MGNRNCFIDVLERLLEAEQLVKIGIERGFLSLIERDILLEKIRASYDQLLFDKKTESIKPSIQSFSTDIKKVKTEPTPEIPKVEDKAETTNIVESSPVENIFPEMEQDINKPQEKIKDETQDGTNNKTQNTEIELNKDISPEIQRETLARNQIVEVEEIKPESNTKPDQQSDAIEQNDNEEKRDTVPHHILAEKFQGKKKFRNDVLGTRKVDVASKLQNKPIVDLTKAIGINDKFLFTKELFKGNAELYSRTIKQLNEFEDINGALIFIQENFQWDERNEAANQLIDLVRRKLLYE